MRKWMVSALILSLGMLLPYADAGKKNTDDDDSKEGLQALQEFIGNWKGGSANDTKLGQWTENQAGAGVSRARTCG